MAKRGQQRQQNFSGGANWKSSSRRRSRGRRMPGRRHRPKHRQSGFGSRRPTARRAWPSAAEVQLNRERFKELTAAQRERNLSLPELRELVGLYDHIMEEAKARGRASQTEETWAPLERLRAGAHRKLTEEVYLRVPAAEGLTTHPELKAAYPKGGRRTRTGRHERQPSRMDPETGGGADRGGDRYPSDWPVPGGRAAPGAGANAWSAGSWHAGSEHAGARKRARLTRYLTRNESSERACRRHAGGSRALLVDPGAPTSNAKDRGDMSDDHGCPAEAAWGEAQIVPCETPCAFD